MWPNASTGPSSHDATLARPRLLRCIKSNPEPCFVSSARLLRQRHTQPTHPNISPPCPLRNKLSKLKMRLLDIIWAQRNLQGATGTTTQDARCTPHPKTLGDSRSPAVPIPWSSHFPSTPVRRIASPPKSYCARHAPIYASLMSNVML